MGSYSVMRTADICEIPVKRISGENCALFLWCTFPNLNEGFKVMKSWGFEYKTQAFTWMKTNTKNKTPFFGIGYYTKSNAEVCLLGIKGKMKPISNGVSSAILSPRRAHSQKPDQVRDRIVQLFGDVPRIELFARQKTPGWNVWGNEVDSDVELSIKEGR